MGNVSNGNFSLSAEATMTGSYLPLLDYTIDLLHDEPEALTRCYLISESWVPRTRRRLFTGIRFRSPSDLESWKVFPDVAKSPANHAYSLFVGCHWLVTASDMEEGGWIRAFSTVASLYVDNSTQYLRASEDSLTPFYKFSPSLKSLRMDPIALPHPQVFDAIRSPFSRT